jgi:hypothetical protein
MPSRLIGFTALTHAKFLTTTESILLNLENHPETPKEVPKPYPTLQELKDSFSKYKDLFHAAENGDRVKLEQRNLARKTTEGDFSNYGHFLVTSGKDTYYLLDVGFSVKQPSAKKNTANASQVPPEDVKVKHGEVPGKFWLRCRRNYGAAMYGVEVTEDPSVESNWSLAGYYTRCSRMEVSGLESGKKYYFRVRNIGGNGPGPWSELVSLICM